MRFILSRFLLLFLLSFIPIQFCDSIEFDPKLRISGENDDAEFSINPHSCLNVDYKGDAHLFFMIPQSGNISQTQIIYRGYENGVLTDLFRVDRGTAGGARNPASVIGPDNGIHVVWNDSRNCTAAGKWIDNVEIYYNKKTAGTGFSSDDVRITKTMASHKGDNGFVPKIAISPAGVLSIVWYDFHRNGTNSDIYFRKSNPDGIFSTEEGIDSWKITSNIDQDKLSYWMPSLAIEPTGLFYLTWGVKKGYSGLFEIQGTQLSEEKIPNEIVTIDPQGGRFDDSPRLSADKNGNLGLIYCVYENSIYRVKFRYKPVNGSWSQAIYVDEGISNAQQADLVFASSGKAQITWQDNRDGFDGIFYGQIDPEKMVVEDSKKISSDDIEAKTPCIAIDPLSDRIHIAWLEKQEIGQNNVFYTREKKAAVESWINY